MKKSDKEKPGYKKGGAVKAGAGSATGRMNKAKQAKKGK